MSASAADPSPGDVVAITDGSLSGCNAVWGAAPIAREQGARLRLLHACGEREAAPAAAHRARGDRLHAWPQAVASL